MINTILLLVAIVILSINIILTIIEALRYYHVYFPSAAHPGRIRGACVQGPGTGGADKGSGWIEIDGMRYNVKWIIIGRETIEDGSK